MSLFLSYFVTKEIIFIQCLSLVLFSTAINGLYNIFMTEKTVSKSSKIYSFINWCFLLYILILGGERIQSIVRCFLEGPDFAFSSFMVGLYNIIVIASLVGGLISLIILDRDFLKALFAGGEVNYKNLLITSGVILISGMVHTEYTILVVQFVSYAFLLLALVLKTILVQKGEKKNRPLLWVSLFYLMAFSMAIPVNYITTLDGAPLFHTLQLLISLATVAYFIYMSDKVFDGDGEHLFFIIPFLIALIGDVFLIIFRWSEYQNLFLLIALAATAVLFIVGKVLELHFKDKEKA